MPLPPSHRMGEGEECCWGVTQGGGPPALRSGGPCPGLFSAAPSGQKSGALCAGTAGFGGSVRLHPV